MLAAAAVVAVGMAAVVVGVGVLVLVVMRMGMRVRMGHTVGMGMRMGVDSFVVIVVKMHGSASLMIFCCIISFPLDFVKRAEARLFVFPKTFCAISRF